MVTTQPGAPLIKNLAKKVVLIMSELGNITKDQKNEHFKYQFISDEAIVNAVQKLLVKHNVAVFTSNKSCVEIIQKTDKGEQTLTKLECEFEFIDADSGESKVVTFFGYGADRSDKGIYKAQTGAEKYCLLKTFKVATYDDPEFEKHQREAAAGFNSAGRTAQAPRPAYVAPSRPVTPPAGVTTTAKPPVAPTTSSAPAPAPAAATPPPATPPAAPAATPPVPPRVSKNEQKTLVTYVDAVTKKAYGTGSSYFKIKTSEGDSLTTFSQTIAQAAKDAAEQGTQVQLLLDMQAKGPVVQSIQPIQSR